MDIHLLEEAALADDVVMRDFYDLNRRAELVGRPDAPFWEFEEFLGATRTLSSGLRQDLFAVFDGDRMVGNATMRSPVEDNTDKAWFHLNVDPPARRRGIGRALVQRVERTAAEDGRTFILADAVLPFADRDGHVYQRFAQACGYELSNYEVVRHLVLPVPDERIQRWIDQAAPHHLEYTLETYVGAVPDEMVESLCVLIGQLAVDAPTGAVDFEEEAVTAQRYAEMGATTGAMGRVRYETVALTADHEVVAQSTLAVPLRASADVYQWGTFVHREHRGHRLGLAMKAFNLRAVQAADGGLARVITQNAETNDYMVSINDQLGFKPIEVAAEYLKRL